MRTRFSICAVLLTPHLLASDLQALQKGPLLRETFVCNCRVVDYLVLSYVIVYTAHHITNSHPPTGTRAKLKLVPYDLLRFGVS